MKYTSTATLLKDTVIIITGAGNGIGAAVAKAYANHGSTVILLDKSIPALEQVYDEIVASGAAQPAIYPLDLQGSSVDDYDTLASTVQENFGRLDGLVHCAASLGQLAPVTHQDTQTWLETLHINLTAPYLLTRACLSLLQQQSSSIIFTTDQHKDTAYWSAYGLSKSGIESLSKQLADELESEAKVRVNCIDPGTVKTELFSRAFPAKDPRFLPSADDVVPAYLYLMGKDSVNKTGELIKAQ
ncbi:SDR family NAD(P)-dependent oxidoreductase [Pseudomonadota bacterium]|nr:SDR family NAD(P)-dependent oxidoreductase [Pseudomonadota bacterium]